ncbi:MAG: HlyD family secretion protein [Pseudomonadales bacterium]|nr:HlyD family secretion protein [Pseudomonadales bacterium]
MTQATSQKAKLYSPSNIIALLIMVGFSIWLASWFYERSKFVYVSDARITASMISIGSRIPGWIVEYAVAEGDKVSKGDVLVQIDPRDAQLKLAELEASLHTIKADHKRLESEYTLTEKQVRSGISASESGLVAAQSALSEAEIEREQTKKDWLRAEQLLKQKMISEETFDMRQSDAGRAEQSYKRKKAETNIARSELSLEHSNLSKLEVINRQMQIVLSKESELEVQRDRLTNIVSDHTIRSPISGFIDETFANPGEYVYPGQRIFMLHNPEIIWIKANVKETDIRNVHIGSHVRVEVDAFPNKTFSGTVSNIGNAATSNFVLLASPNPSGNFVKITQRLEVQIAIDSGKKLLKPGMMVELAIEISDPDEQVENSAHSRK